MAKKPHGIFGCKKPRCKICRSSIGCLVECTQFRVDNGTLWKVPSHVTCDTLMSVYYQICLGCNKFSSVGKTNNFRKRTYQHVSEGKSGMTTDIFDKHVYNCKIDHILPLFKIYILMEVRDYDKLRVYENYFHTQGYDTVNRDKATAK